jgi:uncharacterized protein
VTLFEKAHVVGTFLGFSEGGLEFHADLVLPYQNYFQSSPMHGQFVLVALENDAEAILGRITTISAQGRLISPAGEDYALRQQRENRPIPEDLRDQFLKYRVNIRILGVLRYRDGDKPPLFVPSHRRLPHVGAKVAFPSEELLCHVAGANADGPHAVELGFLALGEFVYAGQDEQDRFGWVYQHGLVRRALDEVLGEGGWRSDPRDGSQWITATGRARSREASLPEPPADRSADDEYGPPPEDQPF